MSGCSRHPSKEATGACINCGKLVCAICDVELGGKTYCQPCAEKLFAAKTAASQEIKPVVTEPSKPVLADSTKSVIKEPEDKDKTVIVASTSASAVATEEKPKDQPAKVGWVWWIPPAILGWIGGMLSWFANKDSEPKTARNMLIGGIGMSVLHGIIGLVLVLALLMPIVIKQGQQSSSSTTKQAPTTSSTTQTPPVSTVSKETPSVKSTGPESSQPIDVMPLPEAIPYPKEELQDYKLTPVFTQLIQPSDKEQSAGYGDEVLVTIPGGELKEAQNLVISKAGNPPAASSGETQLAVYDISFDTQHEFNSALTFEFKYDPHSLSADMPPEMALGIAYFDNVTMSWIPVATKVDPEGSTVMVSTTHNGLWTILNKVDGQSVLLTEHCAVFYDPKDFWTPKVARYDVLNKKYEIMLEAKKKGIAITSDNLSPEEIREYASLLRDTEVMERKSRVDYGGSIPAAESHYYTDNPKVPRYVVDIGYFAEHAWDVYKTKFGREPWLQLLELATWDRLNNDSYIENSLFFTMPYYSTDVTALPIYIDQKYVNPQYSPLSKCISTGYVMTAGGMPELISHEVFHAVQNKDYSMLGRGAMATFTLGMSRSDWWQEGTAEYAAYKIATNNATPSGKHISSSYLIQDFYSWAPLGSEGQGDAWYEVFGDGTHSYKNAYFFDFLVKEYGMDFVSLYKHVVTFNSPAEGLDDYLKSNYLAPKSISEPSLNEYFSKFAAYLVMDENSPVGPSGAEEFPLTKHEQSYSFTNSTGLTCKFVAIKPQVDSSTGKRSLQLALDSEHFGGPYPAPLGPVQYCKVDVYKLDKGQRCPTFSLEPIGSWDLRDPDADFTIKHIVDLSTDDQIYVLVTCYSIAGSNTAYIKITDLSEPTLSIESNLPTGDKGTVCTDYTFTAKYTQMPKGAKFTWFIDGQQVEENKETTIQKFSSSGSHAVKVKAAWQIDNKSYFKEAETTCDIGKPQLEIIAEPVSEPVINTPYEFLVESHYIPDDATYLWHVDGSVAGNDTAILKTDFKAAKPYTITVKAAWDISGCTGDTETKLVFTVKNVDLSIVAAPSPGIAGQESTFSVDGKIPSNPRLSWDFGEDDQSGNLSNNSAKPVTHKYENPGTYPVKVTLMNAEGKIVSSAELSYKVNDQFSLALDMTPKSPIYTDQECLFTTTPNNIPPGSTYTWYINDKQILQAIDKKTATLKAGALSPGTYEIQVVAKWSESLMDSVMATATFVVQGRAAVSIQVPGEGKALQPDKVITFYAVPTNIPDSAFYEWYINGEGVLRAQGKDGREAVAPAGFLKPGDYEILLIVRWTGADSKQQWIQTSAKFKVATSTSTPTATPTLSISASSDTGGMIVNTEYTFTAAMSNATPTGAYTWNVGNGNPNGPLNTASVKCKFVTPGTYTISLKATGKTSEGNKELTAQLIVTVYGNTEVSREEVQFIVYRWVTSKMPSGSSSRARQYCQQYHIQILRDNVVVDGGDSIARNGAFEIVLPTGHYTYKVSGKYLNPDGVCAGASGFDVIKGGRNIVEIEDSPLTKSL